MNKTLMLILSIVLAADLAMLDSLAKVNTGLQMHVLDVGQGDAILLVTPEQNKILIDGGPGQSVLMELSGVLPFLWSEIDLLVLTHPDKDHVEGLVPVLDRFTVGAVLMSAPDHGSLVYRAFLERLAWHTVYLAEDDVDFSLGGVYLDVLYPFEAISGDSLKTVNNASPVIRVEFEDLRILLTGDAEKEVEAALVDAGVDFAAEVFKAGHHGSRTSNTEAFLDAVEPDLALISAGRGNSYGHPHEEIMERFEDRGISVLSTQDEGRISILFGGQLGWVRSILAPRLRSFSSIRS